MFLPSYSPQSCQSDPLKINLTTYPTTHHGVFHEPSLQRNCSKIHEIRIHTPWQNKFSKLLNPK